VTKFQNLIKKMNELNKQSKPEIFNKVVEKEILIDNDYFKCVKSVDEEGRTEWGISYKTNIEKTIKHLVELYDKASYYTEIYEA